MPGEVSRASLVIIYHSTLMYRSRAATAGAGALETLARWIDPGRLARQRWSGPASSSISGYCIAAAGDSVRSGRHSVPK